MALSKSPFFRPVFLVFFDQSMEVFQVKYTKMNGQRCHLTDVKPLSRPSPDALAADALSVDPDVHSVPMIQLGCSR